MSVIARKINIGLAAGAMAAAATLTPITVAQADTTTFAVSTVGSQIGAAQCVPTDTVSCAPLAAANLQGASATPGQIIQSIFQNDLWWIGRANPNPPPQSNILVFTPISLVPGFLKPVYGWFTQNLNFEVCLLGGSVKIGPYGTTTVSVGRGCN
ncbi:MAG: hypothetical protein U5N53_22735 [Mycobacterium sp.]|nr:hypothetical protein [Mycobacterium sp.]